MNVEWNKEIYRIVRFSIGLSITSKTSLKLEWRWFLGRHSACVTFYLHFHRGHVIFYWPKGSTFDFRLCHEMFLYQWIITWHYKLGVFLFVQIGPVLLSAESPAHCWSEIRGDPPVMSYICVWFSGTSSTTGHSLKVPIVSGCQNEEGEVSHFLLMKD